MSFKHIQILRYVITALHWLPFIAKQKELQHTGKVSDDIHTPRKEAQQQLDKHRHVLYIEHKLRNHILQCLYMIMLSTANCCLMSPPWPPRSVGVTKIFCKYVGKLMNTSSAQK